VDKKKRGCLWAALGGAVLVVIVGVAVVGGVAWLVYQDSAVEESASTPEQASASFEGVRSRFTGQAPLVRIDAGGEPHVTPRAGASREGDGLDSLQVLVWEPRQGKVTRLQVPFWLVRLGGAASHMRINGKEHDLQQLHLTVEDVERAGPGLLLDHADDDGSHVLIWTE
jgi:hypothetical protein